MNMPRLLVAVFSIMLSIGVIPAAQAALFSLAFYEETGNINSADPGPGLNNFFDDYTFVGGGTFEIEDTAVGPDELVPFSSGDFLNFSITLSLSDTKTGIDSASQRKGDYYSMTQALLSSFVYSVAVPVDHEPCVQAHQIHLVVVVRQALA
jgi:hypothetical protein